MRGILFFMIALGVISGVAAQITSRVLVQGKISAPIGDDVEGVVVINHTSDQRTITDQSGRFQISLGFNDRVEIVAMQYQKFTVLVTKDVMDSRKLNVFLNESVHLLEEVVVAPHQLVGNPSMDIPAMEVALAGIRDVARLTAATINDTDYDWRDDALSAPHGIPLQAHRWVNGLNFVNIFKAIFTAKKKEQLPVVVEDEIRELYGTHFFKDYLSVEMDQINIFLLFAETNGLSALHLQQGNELELIELLIDQSKTYNRE